MSERVIRETFLDPSVGFTSAEKLYLHLQPTWVSLVLKSYISIYNLNIHPDLKLADVKRWLSSIDSFTMSRTSVRKVRKGSRLPLRLIDEMWDVDLMDMQSHAKENKGVCYVLIVINDFSRFLWTRSLKSKKAKDIVATFDSILQNTEYPKRIRSDGGSEFTNHVVHQGWKLTLGCVNTFGLCVWGRHGERLCMRGGREYMYVNSERTGVVESSIYIYTQVSLVWGWL